MRSHNFRKNKFLLYTAASIFAHMTLFCLLFITAKSGNQKNANEIIEISFDEIPLPSPGPVIPNPTTIVETDSKNANNDLNEKARFLSEKNNTVSKETKAKSGEKFHNAKNSSVAAQQQSEKQKTKKQTKNKNKIPAAKSDIFDNSFDAFSSLNKKENKQQKAQAGANPGDASTTNDNLEKIESDLMTRLNTKEYRYFGYYSRIKSQLNQWWVPKVQQKFTKMLRQGRTIASEDNKITKLVIILNDSGHLVKVQVMAESGIKDLDDAAIEAFRSAAPFPNPPKGMVDKDGLVKIRWDCVVES